MNTQEIVAKLWRLCDVLRDDGITYHQYVTELTYILFLKMALDPTVRLLYQVRSQEECCKSPRTQELSISNH